MPGVGGARGGVSDIAEQVELLDLGVPEVLFHSRNSTKGWVGDVLEGWGLYLIGC